LLEGLEISIIKFSDLFHGERIDSETYRPFYMEIEKEVKKMRYSTLGKLSSVFKKGIFDIKSSTYSTEGIPFVRISNLKKMGIDTDEIICIPEIENKANLSTYLTKGDLILSKTANPAASIVQLDECNTSQDTIAVKLKSEAEVLSTYLVTFLNSKYGFYQMQRWFTGNIQMHLNLTDAKGIFVPVSSEEFQELINNILWKSFSLLDNSKLAYSEAEDVLLDTLKLKDFVPSKEPVNVKNFKESFISSGRLDAEYYQKKYDDIEKELIGNSICSKIYEIRTDNFRGLQPKYYENGCLDVINSKHILEDGLDYGNFEKTERENWIEQKRARVFNGDILTYTTGANIGRTQVYFSNKKAIASNHVNILRLKADYNSRYIGFVMNSFIGRIQTEKLSAGSAQAELYPKDIDQFTIPIIENEKQKAIVNLIDNSANQKKQSGLLLEIAISGVEIMVEKDEQSAIEWILDELEKIEINII